MYRKQLKEAEEHVQSIYITPNINSTLLVATNFVLIAVHIQRELNMITYDSSQLFLLLSVTNSLIFRRSLTKDGRYDNHSQENNIA